MTKSHFEKYLYKGYSMHGTLQSGDLLLVVHRFLDDIQIGDIIVFKETGLHETEKVISHRVVSKKGPDLFTQGDNNSYVDPEPVKANNLIGCVQYLQRGAKLHRVHGGYLGQFRKNLIQHKRSVSWFLRLFYRVIQNCKIVGLIWKPDIKRVEVCSTDGPIFKYTVRNKTIAQWNPKTGEYWCRRPYDLIVQYPGIVSSIQECF